LETRIGKRGVPEVYISYLGEDKRLDTWVTYDQIGEKQEISPIAGPSHASLLAVGHTEKEASWHVLMNQASKPSATVDVHPSSGPSQPIPSAPSSPEREHATVTRVRNFEDVRFGEYLIKTWYYSPYPTVDERADERAASPVPTLALARSISSKRRKLNGNGHGDGIGITAIQPEGPPASNGHSRYTKGNGSTKEASRAKLGMPSSSSVVKAVEATRGRIWVCDVSQV
jgi:histone acetyltransferase MYST1